MIKIIDNIKDFEALKTEWNLLFDECDNITFFQSYEYVHIAWNSFSTESDKLYIIIYTDGKNKLQALFPFYIDKKKRLRFINDIHTDFCNILISSSVNCIYGLMWDIWSVIQKDDRIKFIFMDNLIPSSPIISYWKVFAQNAFVFSQTEHSWVDCVRSNNIINDFNHLNAKERKRLVKIQKDSESTKLRILSSDTDVYPKDEILFLVNKMEKIGLRSSSYFNESMMTFINKIYDNNLIEIAILYNESEPISLGFIFHNEDKNITMRWIILYTDKKYNLWNYVKYTDEKAQQSPCKIDFGRGGYDYKMSNFHPQVESLYRFMYSKTKWENWYVLFKICASHLRKTLKKYHK